MPRRAAAVRREVQPDAVYNNRLVTQLINKILLDGKKSTAEGIVYGAFELVQAKTGEDPLAIFKKAMDNVRPTLEVKPKRVGGATYQVPMEVNSRRATTLAIRWIVDFSRKRKEHTMKQRLAAEIMDAAAKDAMVQHCLPAHRGEEITADVFEAHAKEIFEEAENRLHAQKAVMVKLMA